METIRTPTSMGHSSDAQLILTYSGGIDLNVCNVRTSDSSVDVTPGVCTGLCKGNFRINIFRPQSDGTNLSVQARDDLQHYKHVGPSLASYFVRILIVIAIFYVS
jgi:hypothetical protein